MSKEANAQLKKQIDDQEQKLKGTSSRISSLVDRIVSLEEEVKVFKDRCGADIQNIVKYLKEQK